MREYQDHEYTSEEIDAMHQEWKDSQHIMEMTEADRNKLLTKYIKAQYPTRDLKVEYWKAGFDFLQRAFAWTLIGLILNVYIYLKMPLEFGLVANSIVLLIFNMLFVFVLRLGYEFEWWFQTENTEYDIIYAASYKEVSDWKTVNKVHIRTIVSQKEEKYVLRKVAEEIANDPEYAEYDVIYHKSTCDGSSGNYRLSYH